jgi:hypothetical protein
MNRAAVHRVEPDIPRAVTPPANDVAAMQADAGDIVAAAELFIQAIGR